MTRRRLPRKLVKAIIGIHLTYHTNIVFNFKRNFNTVLPFRKDWSKFQKQLLSYLYRCFQNRQQSREWNIWNLTKVWDSSKSRGPYLLSLSTRHRTVKQRTQKPLYLHSFGQQKHSLEFLNVLKSFAGHNKITLMWFPADMGIRRNE